MQRRDFLRLGAGATLLAAGRTVAADPAPGRAVIPSTGTAVTRIGLGTWRTFDVGNDATQRARLAAVLQVLYLIFNEGYWTSGGPQLHRTDLSNEAIRLTRAARELLPNDSEVVGLLALMLLTDARRAARPPEKREPRRVQQQLGALRRGVQREQRAKGFFRLSTQPARQGNPPQRRAGLHIHVGKSLVEPCRLQHRDVLLVHGRTRQARGHFQRQVAGGVGSVIAPAQVHGAA